MTIKRMTPQQRAVYVLVRRGSVDITLDNARPLHALKRRGLVRFATSYLGVRVALPRRNAATLRAHARQDRLARALDAAYDALPAEHPVLPLEHYAARIHRFQP